MTKQEALDLEKEVDKLFSEKLETECRVSMALTGTLKLSVDYGFFNIKIEEDTQFVDWVKWSGDYMTLYNYINIAIITIINNKEKINKLLQSYGMRREIESEG